MSKHHLTIIFIVFIFAHVVKIVEVGAADDEQPNIQNRPQTEAGGSSGSSNSPDPSTSPKYPPLKLDNQFYCPAEDRDREILDKLQRMSSNILYTLFPRTFNDNQEKSCKYEFEPVLERAKDGNDNKLICGNNRNVFAYIFAFQIWKYSLSPLNLVKYLREVFTRTNSMPQLEFNYSPIYTICYDNSITKVAFTRHKITAHPQYQSLYIKDELSTTPFAFENDYFLKIDRAFRAYNDNPNNLHKMAKQRLVPITDLFPSHQKSAKHFINVAPLWEKLSLLMRVIILSIRRADFQIKHKFHQVNDFFRKSNPQAVHELLIYTKLIYVTPSSQEQQTYQLSIPHTWIKFVHYRAAKLGVLIYIHNIPQDVPREENIYCDAQNRIDCNFARWLGGVHKNMENLEYAYCCKALPLIISLHFSTSVEVVGDLDIERVANGDINVPIPPIPINTVPNISQVDQQRNIASTETLSVPQNIYTPDSSKSQAAPPRDIGGSGTSATPKPISISYPSIRINLNPDNSQAAQPRGITSSNIYSDKGKNISNPQPPIRIKFNSGESSSAQQMTNKSGDISTSAKTTEVVDTSDTSMQVEGKIDTSDLPFQEPEPEPEDLWTKKRYTFKKPRLESDKSSDEE